MGAEHTAAPLVWNAFGRGMGAMYVIALGQLWSQLPALCGPDGITPFERRLNAWRRDFPSLISRVGYLPTLLWISSTIWFMRLLIAVGCVVGAAVALLGGAIVPLWILFVPWTAYLSLMPAAYLFWPWDLLLQEAGFVTLFLDSTCPHPFVAFSLRWLLFRLLVGFGKLKFMGSDDLNKDSLYVTEFLTSQPIPSLTGYYLQRFLPDALSRASLAFFFFAEMIAPWGLVVGTARLQIAAAWVSLALQAGISVSGNFGFFNILTALLALPAFDVSSPASTLTAGDWVHPLAVVFPFTLLALAFNTWVNVSWVHWWTLRWMPFRSLYARLKPWHLFSSYGVFPPHSVPRHRFVPIVEGSSDGLAWKTYGYRFQTVHEGSPPPLVVSPYHPRFEYTFFYTFIGALDSLYISLSADDPYHFSRTTYHHRLALCLLEGKAPVMDLFPRNPFPDPTSPPSFVRIALYMFEPVVAAAAESEGSPVFWRKSFVHEQLHPISLETHAHLWRTWLPIPEIFHADHYLWRRRALNASSLRLSLAGPAVPDWFWEFVANYGPRAPRMASDAADGAPWSVRVDARARIVRERFEPAELRELEKLLGRVTWRLVDATERVALGGDAPMVSHYCFLTLLAHMVIAEGRESVEAVLRNPRAVAPLAATWSLDDAMFFFGLFWNEFLAYSARKYRLMNAIVVRDHSVDAIVPGFLCKPFFDWMMNQYRWQGAEASANGMAAIASDGTDVHGSPEWVPDFVQGWDGWKLAR